ncbi:MAG TPA: hypothetical protein VNU19_02570 [Candidatus Acidoferrum sp.]|nr:hypothetical protein [Candidatus Acidoferrum sp.]
MPEATWLGMAPAEPSEHGRAEAQLGGGIWLLPDAVLTMRSICLTCGRSWRASHYA